MTARKGGATRKTGRAARKGKTEAAAAASEKPKRGHRLTDYRPEYAEQARKLCALGATDKELADFFKCAGSTLSQWKIVQPAFAEALKIGKAEADDRVERSLYQNAVGYSFESEKLFQHEGKVVRAGIVEHVPPSITAQIFWLKNRRRSDWRDKVDHEHSGSLKVSHEQALSELDDDTE